jgi:hypothetical protein
VTVVSCTSAPDESGALDDEAERYVRLALAVGRHDASYVDAYYGPEAWKTDAEDGEPVPLPELLRQARELRADLDDKPRSDRRDFLIKQLRAAEGVVRRLSGESMTLSEETRLLFDVDPPVHPVDEFVAARQRLEELLPGEGDLGGKIEAFRRQYVIPEDRLEAVVSLALELCRERTLPHVALPHGESFRYSLVAERPWGAYNWYQGELHSLIEVNTDLPIELASIFRTMCHEGYPGHHTYNVLLEDRLVRGRGWQEFTIYPLYSPQSLLAEGTANAGRGVVLTDDEYWELLASALAPAAGLEDRDLAAYRAVLEALRPLRYVRGEAARMLFDQGVDADEIVDFLMRFELVSEERARKTIEFLQAYRSYIFTYTVGEDLVDAYLGEGPDRTERFFDILQRPITPSHLVGE